MTPADAEPLLRRAMAASRAASSDYDLDPGLPRPMGRDLRPAAVLLAVDLSGPEARVILTKRSPHLRHHPGQIALPGGAVDPGEDSAACALREAFEEIGLPLSHGEILGAYGPHETVTAFSVTAVLALVREPFDPRPEAGEVAEVFSVPLSHLADPANYRVEGRRWQGRHRRYWVVPWGPYYIWGATARLLRGLAERIDAARA
ncbi:putative nudix hydrolase YeaB [Rubellimicrobium mesophilum DSM 19309]|uniref:Putative nudix hydrolase YeaB n=1 Tax=Rubellimicrobium mesophilum DSM 19309 TaxID=442562 RepID=A0A017HM25_9RHOB|nr:putative nudix hydrolase YeaB [Rubellimicrobium mesophilum DSM 19309]